MKLKISILILGLASDASYAAAARGTLSAPCATLVPGSFRDGARDLTALTSGVPTEGTVSPLAAGVQAQIMLDSQFTIDVPAAAESLLLVLASQDEIEDNFDFAVRFGVPVEVTATTARADYWVMFPLGREELGIHGDDLAPGRWYIAIISRSPTGGKLTFTATVDGAFVDAPFGVPVHFEVPSGTAAPENTDRLDGQQYRVTVPGDARNLLVELRTTNAGADARFALRTDAPVAVDADGTLIADRQIDARGGYGVVCLAASLLPHGQQLYVRVLNASEGILRGELTLSVNACAPTLVPGAAIDGIVPAVPPLSGPDTLALAETQYVIPPATAAEGKCMHLEIRVPDGDAPLTLLCRKGAPVRMESDGGVPVLARDWELALPRGTTRVLVKPYCVGDEELHVVVGSRSAEARLYELTLLVVDCPFARGAHPFLRGDANGDGDIDIGDAIRSLGYLFGGRTPVSCQDAIDTNDNGNIDLSDAITLLSYLFAKLPAPPPPFGQCGNDPTADTLDCLDCTGCLPCVSIVASGVAAAE